MLIKNRKLLVEVAVWFAVFLAVASIAITCQACATPVNLKLGRPRAPSSQAAAAVRVESECELADPFGSGDALVFRPPWSGSGTQLDRQHVLTALHVVDCPVITAVRITYADGLSRAMQVQRVDRDSDLALLETASAEDLPDLGEPEIGPRPGPGAMVCSATAYPKAGWDCGNVSEVNDQAKWDLADPGLVVPGNSGSAVYDAEGRLVAVVSAGSWCDPDHHEDGFCGRITTSLAGHRAKLGI